MNKDIQTENEYSKVLEDNFLKHIGHEYTELLSDQLDQEEDEWKDIEIPDSLNQWFEDFNKLEKKRRKKEERRLQLLKHSRRAAILILMMIGVNYFLVSNVEAYRIKWMNTISSIQDKFTQIDIVPDEQKNITDIPENWEGNYYPVYVPEGFKLTEQHSTELTIRLVYEDDQNNQIVLHQFSSLTSLQVDSEGGASSKVMVGEREATLIKKDGMINLNWSIDDSVLYITTKGIKINELIKIAESVILKK